MEARLIRCLLLFALSFPALGQGFDQSHRLWSGLLGKHLVVFSDGKASQLSYGDMKKERAVLKEYLDGLSAVTQAEFDSWSKPQRMAFLINAYNAFTVEKVLTRYPDLVSIRDFGKVVGNPFKDEFFLLLGRRMSLDGIEHGLLRKKGAYDEPRLHFALNCASVSCPMLRKEPYLAERLEAQLEEQTERFLSDRSRNRFANGRLEVSRIFDWYKDDFAPLEKFLARHAGPLAPAGAPVVFLEYDWTLNDSPSSSRR